MPDRQGKPSGEAAVEHITKRPLENWQPDGTPNPVGAATNAILTGGSPMPPSFAGQIELLTALKNHLTNLQQGLLHASSEYQKAVEFMGQHLLSETYNNYSANEFMATKSQIQRLVDHISANDIQGINQRISHLQQGR